MEYIYSLITKEGWEVVTEDGIQKIKAFDELFPLTHPINIHFKFYREITNPERKYLHMKAIHDYLWPDEIESWHYWTERRFREHCANWNYITLAGGANSTKSYDIAKIAIIFWLANPAKRGVIVASTTLTSLDARIWGYIKKFMRKAKFLPKVSYTASPNPRFLVESDNKTNNSSLDRMKDTLHGLFAIAAKKGDDDEAIAGWIGRHPEDKLLLVLDEATDMPLSILKAFPNLELKMDKFQCMAIGNSLSIFDLHGTLSTPKNGWNSVDPAQDIMWETTQRNGVCLFFSCYDSPAIHETDPVKKKLLEKFLITEDEVKAKEIELGKDSDSFYRFVLGYWKRGSGADVVIPVDYIEMYGLKELAEWAGVYPLQLVWGLDPSFTTDGDTCILRAAILGVDMRGKMVLDFRDNKLLFRIPILANIKKSTELQVIDGVLRVLIDNGIPIENGCYDGNGSGRLLGESLRIQYERMGGYCQRMPKKVIATRLGNGMQGEDEAGTLVRTPYDLWSTFKGFMENEQIRGLDNVTLFQFTNRRTLVDEKTRKIKLESKKEYKRRVGAIMKNMARSPDEGDAASFTLQSAINNFGFFAGQEMQLENPFMIEKMYHIHTAVAKQQEHARVKSSPNLVPSFTADLTSLVGRVGKLF